MICGKKNRGAEGISVLGLQKIRITDTSAEVKVTSNIMHEPPREMSKKEYISI